MAWRGGLLVCAAPEILFLKDHDGDHIADSQEVLFTGFFANNSEAQITNLKFNVDNWIYGSNHGNPGTVRFVRRPDVPAISVQGTDFRFRLDRGLFEPAAGSSQFGQAITEWGQRFGTQNTIHISQIVIPWHYLQKDSSGQAKAPVQNISDHDLEMFQLTPPPYWRAERTARRQKAYDQQNLDRMEYAEDHFTGCSGGTVYTGSLFPEAYRGSVFTGDVAGNLIHRDVLVPGDGPLFVARRDMSEQHREFLASTDPWFRPANFAVAPDGSLMVVDFYRQHIETPLSIPEDLKRTMDFYNGDDKGRIYRIVPADYRPTASAVKYPGEMTGSQLVTLLAHPDQWWRTTAQRLLLERKDTSTVPLLRQMVQENLQPLARLHALFALEGLQKLDMQLVSTALADQHPEIRVRAIQLAENFEPLLPQLVGMTEDPSVKVRFQLALSLGVLSGDGIDQALSKLLLQN
jgi:putative membrane-bound dehydrogenase-like protein